MLEQLIAKSKQAVTYEGPTGRFHAARLGSQLACMLVAGSLDEEAIDPFDACLEQILEAGVELFVDAAELEQFTPKLRDAVTKAFWRRRDRFFKIHVLYTQQALGVALLTGRMVFGKQLRSYNQREPWLDHLDSARIRERFAGMDLA